MLDAVPPFVAQLADYHEQLDRDGPNPLSARLSGAEREERDKIVRRVRVSKSGAQSTPQRILALLCRIGGQMLHAEIKALLGDVTGDQVSDAIKDLLRAGKIVKHGESRNNRGFRYDVRKG